MRRNEKGRGHHRPPRPSNLLRCPESRRQIALLHRRRQLWRCNPARSRSPRRTGQRHAPVVSVFLNITPPFLEDEEGAVVWSSLARCLTGGADRETAAGKKNESREEASEENGARRTQTESALG